MTLMNSVSPQTDKCGGVQRSEERRAPTTGDKNSLDVLRRLRTSRLLSECVSRISPAAPLFSGRESRTETRQDVTKVKTLDLEHPNTLAKIKTASLGAESIQGRRMLTL